mmetsp:Transcript_111682/g.315868  ORF Transcript_111682/g.315868 Transcript_111682/m.315868 type:complete len:225 (+) Transcript_111682:226-900(+)
MAVRHPVSLNDLNQLHALNRHFQRLGIVNALYEAALENFDGRSPHIIARTGCSTDHHVLNFLGAQRNCTWHSEKHLEGLGHREVVQNLGDRCRNFGIQHGHVHSSNGLFDYLAKVPHVCKERGLKRRFRPLPCPLGSRPWTLCIQSTEKSVNPIWTTSTRKQNRWVVCHGLIAIQTFPPFLPCLKMRYCFKYVGMDPNGIGLLVSISGDGKANGHVLKDIGANV